MPFKIRSDLLPRFGYRSAALRKTVRGVLQDTLKAVVALPLAVKFLVILFLVADFLVITNWNDLPFSHTKRPAPIAEPAPAKNSKKDELAAEAKAAANQKLIEAAKKKRVLERMQPIVMQDPQVRSDGSIFNKGKRLYLYELKPFNSKNVCRHSSGAPWACGLEAYATLHNEIAHQKVTCIPKEITADGVGVACRMNDTNIALVLIRKGLAALDPKATELALRDAQRVARSQKLGIWDR